jgi:RNA polymerase sigma-70 factor (ECF subfamily)
MPLDTGTFEQHRGLLFGVAYRMLGSASEAEDVVQDAYLRVMGSRDEAIREPRAFLTTIVTRLCLDRLKAARAIREQYIGPWLPEPILLEPDDGAGEARAERAETVGMAALVLLEALNPLERAVFLLREAFEYPFDEIAAMLGRSAATCRQAYHRARAHLDARRRRFPATPERQQALVTEFLAAARDGNLAALTASLAQDVVFSSDGGGVVTAARKPLHGATTVARLVAGLTAKGAAATGPAYSTTRAWVNGAPAVLIWAGERLDAVWVFECGPGVIETIWVVRNPAKLAHLAARVTPGGSARPDQLLAPRGAS